MSFIHNSITINLISQPDHLHSERLLSLSISLCTFRLYADRKNMKKFMPGSDRGTRYVRAALGCQNYVTLACLYTD